LEVFLRTRAKLMYFERKDETRLDRERREKASMS